MNSSRNSHDNYDHHNANRADPTVRSFDGYQLFIGNDRSDHNLGSDAKMDIAFGRAGNDHLSGGGMGDDLIGGIGNDQLIGGAGSDHLDGFQTIGSLEAMERTPSWDGTAVTT